MIYGRLGLVAIARGKILAFSSGIPQDGTNTQGKREISGGPFQWVASQRNCELDDQRATEEFET